MHRNCRLLNRLPNCAYTAYPSWSQLLRHKYLHIYLSFHRDLANELILTTLAITITSHVLCPEVLVVVLYRSLLLAITLVTLAMSEVRWLTSLCSRLDLMLPSTPF